MEVTKERVVINLNGQQIPFLVEKTDEPYFRDAKEILNDRLAALTSDYAAFATEKQLVTVLAIEALVDALKVNERYQRLRGEVQGRLENIHDRFKD
jgi:cell division protein ZapA (FtsZ GTPase activity inhibitor)